MSYYSILGVDPSSSAEEIKKAYRSLAKEHHPDRGGDAEKFKQINEAYDVLKDPQKRQEYDRPKQHRFDSNNFSSSFTNAQFDDLFQNIFKSRQYQIKNRDIIINVTVNLRDVFENKTEIIQYRLGNGNIETVTVEIPAGAKTGDSIHYKGLGDNTDPRLTRGDLYVKVHVEEPSNWARDGANLITKQKVNVFDILTGCAIIVNTLDGKRVNLKIPQGTKPGTILSVSGYGVPDIRTKKKGNLYIQVEVEMTKINDPEILSKIEDIKKIIKERQ